MDKEQALKELGLNDNEIKLYLSLLLLGESKVQELAKQTNIIRTTIYDILKSLEEKGFVSHVINEGIKYYNAESPSEIKTKFQEKVEHFDEIKGQLEALRKHKAKKYDVKVFEGKEGIKTILNEILKTRANHKIIGNFLTFQNLVKFYFPNYVQQRVKNKISIKAVREHNKDAEEYKKRDKKELRKTRISTKLNKINAECFIYQNKVIFLSLIEEDLKGIIIENEEIVKLQDTLFENFFNNTK